MTTETAKARFKKAIERAKKLYKTGRYKTFADAVKAAYKSQTIGCTTIGNPGATKKRAAPINNNKTQTMARRRHHRRRRIGSVGKLNSNSPLVKYAPPVVGYLVADSINTQVDKLYANVTDTTKKALYEKITHAAMISVWAWYVFSRKGQKNPLPTIALGVLAGAGLKGLMTDLNVGIAGFQQVPVVAGYQNVPVVSGYGATAPNPALNGIGAPPPNLYPAGYTPSPSVMSGVGGIYQDQAAGLLRQE